MEWTLISRGDCKLRPYTLVSKTDPWYRALANYAQLLPYYAMPAMLVKPSYYAQYYAS